VTAAMLVFFVVAAVAVGAALVVVIHRNPVIQALSLVVFLLAVAGVFVLLNAQFLAALQVIIYAGAIVVLITFVIMLLNLGPEARGGPGIPTLLIAFLLGALLIGVLGRAGLTFEPLSANTPVSPTGVLPHAPGYGSVAAFGRALFSTYFYPFEAVSLAIVAALTGAVLLAKRKLED